MCSSFVSADWRRQPAQNLLKSKALGVLSSEPDLAGIRYSLTVPGAYLALFERQFTGVCLHCLMPSQFFEKDQLVQFFQSNSYLLGVFMCVELRASIKLILKCKLTYF